MTSEERDTAAAAILTQQDRITRWEELQVEIDRLTKATWNVKAVLILTDDDKWNLTNENIIGMAETKLAERLTAKQAEQDAI